MEPREKTLELYNYYRELIKDFTRGVSIDELAKLCALKVVDEIILEREVIFAARDIPTGTFWHEVKIEIEAL
jgi:hypothetical protein